MDNFFENIDKQIEFNKGKNIFCEDRHSFFKFIEETVNAISNFKEVSADSENILIDYATDKSLEEFCRMNQYFTFNHQAKNDLRNIYCDLFSSIRTKKTSIDLISKRHYDLIKEWLQKTNPFAYKMYSNAEIDIQAVACSEYSADLQMDVLKIDINNLMSPVLDIGCGKQASLVNHLCDCGIDAYGIDRFSFTNNKLLNTDWLEFNYGIDKWGTIVSNLGFSNHFKHHNLREDGHYIEYGRKYLEILKSLKINGKFHYAPDLPFIELYLNSDQYMVDKHLIEGFDFQTTIITRLK